MSVSENTRLLSQVVESECIFDGGWVLASGTPLPVVEPASAEVLMKNAMANPANIAVACRSAVASFFKADEAPGAGR